MGRKKADEKPTYQPTTVEGRENQLIALAFDLAEKQMKDGSAPATVTTHFLKLGSTREKLEHEKLRNENLLLSAKVDALASAKRVEELMGEALDAFRQYSGHQAEEFDDFDDFEDF